MVKYNKKGISTPEFIFSILSSIIIIITVVVLFNVVFTSCSSDNLYYMNEHLISNLNQEALFLFLSKPVDALLPIQPFIINEKFYDDRKIDRYLSLPIELNENGIKFQLKVDDIEDFYSMILEIKPAHYSNIAVINGSLDNILDLLESNSIYPDIITWDELSDHHSHVFAGCSVPFPTSNQYVINWINSGGTLITTDYSVRLIESLFGKQYIFTNNISIRSEPVTIEFKNSANQLLGLSGKANVKDVFLADISNSSEILAEYVDLNENEPCLRHDDGCGAPIQTFSVGNGRVIHFTFHLDENEDVIKPFLEKLPSNFKTAESFSLYNESEDLIIEFNDIDKNDIFSISMVDHFKGCDFDCYFNFILKGEDWIMLRSPKLEYYSSSLYSFDKMPLVDLLIHGLSQNDKDKIDEIKLILTDFVSAIDSDSLSHKIIVSKINEDLVEEKLFEIVSKDLSTFFKSSTIRTTAEVILPSYDPDIKFKIELQNGISAKASRGILANTLLIFLGWR